MSDVYDEIKNQSNIETILEHYGIRVSKNKCLCPFHNDTNPSMSIHQSKKFVKCFVCGSGADAITFIQKYENEINNNNISLSDAMQKAIDIQNLNIKIQSNNSIQLTEEQKEFQRQSGIIRETINLNEKCLNTNNNESKNALEYLKNRKITPKIIKTFHIGYSPQKSTYITENLAPKYSTKDLVDVGVSKISEYGEILDVFNGRITIPIFDENGKSVGFGARTTNNTTKPKYLNTRANKLFDKSNLLFNYHQAKYYARNDEIIIVEGYMDVISGKAMKMDNVVGTMGTAITQKHIELLKKLNCDILLCLDNDEAGKDAMIRIIPELQKENLNVSVLDISKLGNYKDFGDLHDAGILRENIYSTKISAFTFLMKYKYIKNNSLNVDNIHNLYNKMWKDGFIKSTKDIINFKEYIISNTNFNSEEVDKIIKPTEIKKENEKINEYKNKFFGSYLKNLIIDYAKKREDNILLKYIEQGKLEDNFILDTIKDFLKEDAFSINIGSYIRDFLFNTKEYIDFKNDKKNILDKLLNNVKSFDNNGNVVKLQLTLKQKEMVICQYNDSFDSSIKQYIEDNPDEFEEIFIANNSEQFSRLFPKTYEQNMKETAINEFKNDLRMGAINYAAAFSSEMKSALSKDFVNNNKFKTLLVFNNNKNILELTTNNIIKEKDEKEIEKVPTKEIEYNTNEKKTIQKENKPMSVFITLSGKEKESYRGMYLPINDQMQVFIPKELYKKNDKKIEIINNQMNKADMSEYKVDEKEQKMKWFSKLTLEDFYKKYFSIYEVKLLPNLQPEKEVMV